ncbi:MAG TPA: hypothetical protein VIA80_06670 [Hyphomonadaceae bacterium]|jgi:hypothetical protein
MNADSQYRLYGLSMSAAKKTQQMQTALKKTGNRLHEPPVVRVAGFRRALRKKIAMQWRLVHAHRLCCDALFPAREAV